MTILSWNEIKDRALKFSKEWADTHNEEADAKPFLDAFFNVFGITRKRVGTFEHKVKKIDDANGYIDLLWKGVILIEMKSRGKNLDKAFEQAIAYTHNLKERELPRYILVCDFHEFRLYDTSEQTTQSFTLDRLIDHIAHFGFIAGYEKKSYKEQDPVNIKAAEHMGKLHDALKAIGYDGHPLEVYLVRILFCLFAEDTTIFEKQQFQNYIEQRTADDGSDLAAKIAELFQVLNTPKDKRFKNLDEQLAAFPYVNGKLFEEMLPTASFDATMRRALLECCYIDWSLISPAIFGSMFQSVMNPIERRNLGAHYTSEHNILKLIKPLFLDALYDEFNSITTKSRNKAHTTAALTAFHDRIAALKFLDPACGCGNFLIITYRELRLLELEIIKVLHNKDQLLDIDTMALLNVDMMYGIEYEEFPARIAEVAMWLIDHQMNMQLSAEFGQYYARLPLRRAAQITHGDALATDWHTVIPNNELSYILGNPPFIGSTWQTREQKDGMSVVAGDIKGYGILDYVAAWYLKAAQYIQNTPIKAAFVSTNSIVQGEQVAVLWGAMLNKYGMHIHFAHRTFSWRNEAKGNAAVHCVIIGFAHCDTTNKVIFDYEDIKGESHATYATNINAYLVNAPSILIQSRKTPMCDVIGMSHGNKPVDGGHLILSDDEKNQLIQQEPLATKFIKKLTGAQEYIQNIPRWCLWLIDASPTELKAMPHVMARIALVKKMREASVDEGARKLAERPSQFRDIKNPDSFVIVPAVSSERRRYIPMGFLDGATIPTNLVSIIPNATLYHFGILTSLMHMAWVKTVCGRLESRFRYSKDIVYNNFPWPEPAHHSRAGGNPDQCAALAEDASEANVDGALRAPLDARLRGNDGSHNKEKENNDAKAWLQKKAKIESAAQTVLDARAAHPDASLADLYDPLTMPANLVKAHAALDKAVDAAYGFKGTSDSQRVAFLFDLYQTYTHRLIADAPAKPKRSKKS